MKSCLLCPSDTKCKGYVLHGLIVKIYKAIVSSHGEKELDAITGQFSVEDMEILLKHGDSARVTCWSKGLVFAVARILAHMVEGKAYSDIVLRTKIEEMLRTMLRVMSRLPKGIKLDLNELSMDIYNRTIQILSQTGSASSLPMTTYGQACANVLRARQQKVG